MRFERIGRTSGAFQESVSAEQIVEMGRRAFGTEVVSAVELGGGLYNYTYRSAWITRARATGPTSISRFCT
ncbi:MAG: aminoglycoside phosphotransferase family protein [Amycolatopsis sp.]|uniref:hypothetical protein n=1 Tax=Amycolatopsis sp. TaxID=37632 RepID=UPI002631DD70|nr:hypothetical protein [Amycolatopsis sp.]MCU1686930.1 aminoglycoside phosphotransferase family protein [Amycolatopsis sp.]